MNWNIKDRTSELAIEHGGVVLAVLKRELLLMEQVRFHKSSVPLVCKWQLRFTTRVNSPFDPAYDYANARIEHEVLDANRAELRGEAHTKDGLLTCRFNVVIEVQPGDKIIYHTRQSLHVHRDYVLADASGGSFVTPDKKVAKLEFTDPYFIQAVGPSTPFTRDCPEMTWPMPVFLKHHQKWWDYTTYSDVSGEIIAFPNNHAIGAGMLPIKKGGFAGMFWKRDGENPVIELSRNISRPVHLGVCDMYYDLHFGHLLPVENGRCVLRAGEQFEVNYRFLTYEGAKAADIAKQMRMRTISAEELKRLDRPAYRAGLNTFAESLHLFDESLPWWPARGAFWDKQVGHGDNFSLRVESSGGEPAQWEINVGRDLLFDPLVEGATYRLRAWAKTAGVTGNGARIGFGNRVAKFPGISNDSPPVEYRWSQTIKGNSDWTLLEVTGLPVPKDTLYANLVLQLDGTGKAWFDDVEFCACS